MSARAAGTRGGDATSSGMGYLVVSAMGKDRPGIVDDFSKFILERDCNIEDSRMAVLGGEFALIVLIAGEQGKVSRIQADIEEFARRSHLTITSRPTQPPGARPVEEFVLYRLRGTGVDHPGIVHKFSHILHEANANIESLDTHTYSAPVSGAPIFHFDMVVEVPARIPIAALRERLMKLADAENIDLEVHPVVRGEGN